MKVEDLKNTKIYLSNEDDRVKFQEKVFELGVEWPVFGKKVINTGYLFYYINSELLLSSTGVFDKSFFIEKNSRQIFLDDVLSIEEPKKKCKFKPFDKVLVRDSDNKRWRPRIFSWHDVDYSEDYPYPFETTDGDFYSYCIPYDENLANTTKNPE